MTFEQFEQFISRSLSSLPRRAIPSGHKEDVWARVQNHIRQSRKQYDALAHSFGFFGFLRASRLAVTALTVIIAVSLLGGFANASQGSLPGDTLYTVKKAMEQVQVAVASVQGPEKKIETLKNHAKTRLQEVSALVSEKTAPKELVKETLNDLKTATDKVVAEATEKPELINHAIELAREEKTTLDQVENEAEGEVKTTVQTAITETKESLDNIISQERKDDGDKTVKGEDTTSGTPVLAKPAQTERYYTKPTEPSEKFESGIQLHGVMTPDQTASGDNSDNIPTILPEPNNEF